jgi:hypothetical protein
VNPFFQLLKDENDLMVSLRGPSSKHFWENLEELGAQLEESVEFADNNIEKTI